MTRLLLLLRDHPKAVEAFLSQYHNIDIRDRDVRDEHGRRKLTPAMIAARVLYWRPEGNPIDTALNGGVRPPSRTELILSDLFSLRAGEPSPRLQFAERAAVAKEDPGRKELLAQRSREAREKAERKKKSE